MTESINVFCLCMSRIILTSECLNALAFTSRIGCYNAIVPLVTLCISFGLFNGSFTANGALLTFGKTCFCTSSILARNYFFFMTESGNCLCFVVVASRAIASFFAFLCARRSRSLNKCAHIVTKSTHFIICVIITTVTSISGVTFCLTSRSTYNRLIIVSVCLTLCSITKHTSHWSCTSSFCVYMLVGINTSVEYGLRIPPFSGKCVKVIASNGYIVRLIPYIGPIKLCCVSLIHTTEYNVFVTEIFAFVYAISIGICHLYPLI